MKRISMTIRFYKNLRRIANKNQIMKKIFLKRTFILKNDYYNYIYN